MSVAHGRKIGGSSWGFRRLELRVAGDSGSRRASAGGGGRSGRRRRWWELVGDEAARQPGRGGGARQAPGYEGRSWRSSSSGAAGGRRSICRLASWRAGSGAPGSGQSDGSWLGTAAVAVGWSHGTGSGVGGGAGRWRRQLVVAGGARALEAGCGSWSELGMARAMPRAGGKWRERECVEEAQDKNATGREREKGK